jgi:two-component system KDP operon response regulator KdpE
VLDLGLPDRDGIDMIGEIRIDLIRRQIWRGDAEIHLTPIEYKLLGLLLAKLGKVVTHRQLLREVWGPSHVDDTHYLRVCVCVCVYMVGLRRKLEIDPKLPRHIRTEAGIGYRLIE